MIARCVKNRALWLISVFLAAVLGIAQASPSNWTGDYQPCNNHRDLLQRGHLDLGIRLSTHDAALAHQFERAMDFWAAVVDLDWHIDNSEDCSIQLVDGSPALFDIGGGHSSTVARSHLPDLPAFEGWIAFNPGLKLTEQEMFLISVHEIGHVLGLSHNPSASSVMFFLDLDDNVSLDIADLTALATRHKLRPGILDRAGIVSTRVSLPSY